MKFFISLPAGSAHSGHPTESAVYSQRLVNSINTISQESSLALQALYNNYHDNVIAAAMLIAN